MKLASTFEYGLIMEAKGWLSNGEPCPYTKVKDGVGVIFNFGDGFLEQLLQSQSPQTLGDAKSDSNQTTINNFKELKIGP